MLVNQPGGYAEMGVFSAASQWRTAIGVHTGRPRAVCAATLVKSQRGARRVRYGKALRWNLILTAVAATAVAVPVTLGAPQIMRLYGRGFQQGWLVLVLSAATAVLVASMALWEQPYSAPDPSGPVLRSTPCGLWCFLRFLLLHSHDLALGLAGSMLGAYIAHTAWQAVYLRHRLARLDSA